MTFNYEFELCLLSSHDNNMLGSVSVQMFETEAHGYLSESTQRKLSNEYQYDRVKRV